MDAFKSRKNLILLILIYFLFSCGQNTNSRLNNRQIKKKEELVLSDFNNLAKMHKKIGKPEPGDWLFHHEEKGQSFQE